MTNAEKRGGTITEAVMASFAASPDPRIGKVATSLVQHLHAFIRDVEPSFEEWQVAIDFLTRTGQTCTGARQEFILLSDILGASMLVDLLAHGDRPEVTPSTVLGPFHALAPTFSDGDDISAGASGEPLWVECGIMSEDGRPLTGAIVDVWQADSEGLYDVQIGDEPRLRAVLLSDKDGRIGFWTILPSPYPIPSDGPVGELLERSGRHPWRPAHIHFRISAEGHTTLVTHIFVAGSDHIESDAVFGVKPELIDSFSNQPPGIGPAGRMLDRPWHRLDRSFSLAIAG